MIETLVGHRITVPKALVTLARSQLPSFQLKLALPSDDIWTIYDPVAEHADNHVADFAIYGLVLVNDPLYVLVHGGKAYDIPPGTLYRFDGRIPHCTRGPCGLFAALVWDMPNVWDLDDFAAELHRDKRFM